MIETWLKAVIGISAILCGWLTVQMAWRRFAGASPSEDPLAGRLGCHGCGCHVRCEGTDGGEDEKQINERDQKDLVKT
jgi:hypothetical protein